APQRANLRALRLQDVRYGSVSMRSSANATEPRGTRLTREWILLGAHEFGGPSSKELLINPDGGHPCPKCLLDRPSPTRKGCRRWRGWRRRCGRGSSPEPSCLARGPSTSTEVPRVQAACLTVLRLRERGAGAGEGGEGAVGVDRPRSRRVSRGGRARVKWNR